MKGRIMLEILSILEKRDSSLTDLIEHTCGLTLNFREGENNLRISKKGCFLKDFKKMTEKRKLVKRFYAMISYLEKDGLICRFFQREGFYLKITSRGKNKLEVLKNRLNNALPHWDYKPKSGKLKASERGVVIIAFDIPEKERAKREWLRNALRSLNFEMIQRSVWMGKGKLPLDFVNDLKVMNLAGYVRIFQINRLGSLRQIV